MKKKVATIATAAILSSTLSTTAFADTYKVQLGDTLFKIAKNNQTTVSNLKEWNHLSSDNISVDQSLTISAVPSSSNTQTPTPTPSVQTYTIVSGDTLIKIANQYGISLAELKLWNQIEGSVIHPGQVLNVSQPVNTGSWQTIPASAPILTENAATTEYVIKSGDTLSTIAVQYGLNAEQLKSFNNLTSDLIFPGQKLKVAAQPIETISNIHPVVEQVSPTISVVINEAKNLIGLPYVWGGSTTAGFDCSGFIYYVYNQAGQSLKRLSAAGYYDRSYYVNTPQVGDLVFFQNTYMQGISHVGVYLGNNEFIHAGSEAVQISNLDESYWKQHFANFKRFY